MTSGGSGSRRPGSKTILFGGSGFLGRCILENYPGIVSVGRTDPLTSNAHIQIETLANLEVLREVDFDKVIFIIGHSDRYSLEKETLDRNKPTAFDYHVTPLIQAMEQLKQYPITRALHFSTVLLYDRAHLRLPVDELAPIDPYRTRHVLSKHIAEELCRFYSQWIPIINVRLSNVYGPTRLERYDVVHCLVRQLLEKREATVWSTRPSRDFIFVEDVAHAVVKLLDADVTGTLNLGSGTMTSVSTIVELLREISGCPIYDESREVEGPMKFVCDMTRLNSLIDWTPSYSTEQGVHRTYELMSQWSRG